MDSSNSSPNLLALALGTHTVDIEQMMLEQRYQLVQGVIEWCRPLKYFPGFRSVNELVNQAHVGFIRETPSKALTMEVPLGRLFMLTCFSKRFFDEEGIVKQECLLLDDSGKFVLWNEVVRKVERLKQEVVLRSDFTLPSDSYVKSAILQILQNPRVTLDIVRSLASAAEADASKRFERLQCLERATVHLRDLKERLIIGGPSDFDDDIPF